MKKTSLLIIFCIFISMFIHIDIVDAASSTATNLTAIVKVSDAMSYINLEWDADTSSTYYYKIERKSGNDDYEDVGGYNSAYDDSYTDIMSGSQMGISYSYRVGKYDSKFELIGYSNTVSLVLKESSEPTNFEASNITNGKITLTWDFLNEAPLATIIERKVEGDDISTDNVWEQIGGTNGSTDYFEDTNVNTDLVYTYRIRCILGTNCYSPYVETSSVRSTLVKPSSFTVSLLNENGALLEWGNIWSQDVDIYVDRKINDGEFITIESLTDNEGAYLDDTITIGNSYTYRIQARGRYSGTYSYYSDEITIIPIDIPAPSGLTVTATSNTTIDLSWSDNSNDESGFEIWRRNGDGTAWVKYAVVSANEESYTDKNLSPAVLYSYKVRAFSSLANVSSIFTSEKSSKTIIPSANIILDYSCANNVPTLRWEIAGALDNECILQLEKRGEYDLAWSELPSVSISTDYYTDSVLKPYTRYSYRLKLTNTENNSAAYSNTLVFSTGEPASPKNLNLTALGANTVKLEWEDGSMNEEGFIIERNAGGTGYMQLAKVASGETSYIDNLLTSGKIYTYRVSAYNKSGISGYTDYKYFTSKAPSTFYDMSESSWALKAVLSLADTGIISGTSQGYFSPNENINRAEFTSMVVKALNLKELHSTNFIDIKPSDWYYDDIMTAKAYGIISGTDDFFYPDSPITREDTAVILCKGLEAANKPLAGKDSSILDNYSDRDLISDYAVSFLSSMKAEGLMNGKDGNRLAPKDYLSRAEAAAIIWRIISK